MKRSIIFSVFLAVLISAGAQIYHDAREFDILGTVLEGQDNPYGRLPEELQSQVPSALWSLGRNTAGMAVRFATDASSIHVTWSNLSHTVMNHMCQTGIRGVDLYVLTDDDSWTFVGSGIPGSGSSNSSNIVTGLSKEMREYLLYLPLYDGITDLKIGVNSGAEIRKTDLNMPVRQQPIVMYGTSILQGGCATRPGMAHTNILERMLNREVYNFGFSGNGHLHPEIAQLLASINAGLYVIDVLPNNTAASMQQKLGPFYDILRNTHPDTPILLVGSPYFPRANYDPQYKYSIGALNNVVKKFYDERRAQGDKNIFYFDGATILDSGYEGTIDGVHFTDIGFQHFAEAMYDTLCEILEY